MKRAFFRSCRLFHLVSSFAMCLFTVACQGSPAQKPAKLLELNDVSILMPLPEQLEAPGYLSAQSVGARGELLPRDVFDAIGGFPVTTENSLNYLRMRVIAARFDGCHRKQGVCEAQIRLVMQPLNNDGSGRDSSLHLFYSLTESELVSVVAEIRALQTLSPESKNQPLDVHPALLAQGIEGAYGTALSALLLRHTGEENLSRVTFFLRAPPLQETWFFGGLERVNGTLTPMEIVGIPSGGNQRVIRPEISGGYEYAVDPAAIEPEDGRALLSSSGANAATESKRREVFASYLRVANPNLYDVEDLPCAGCHVSSFVMARARENFGLSEEQFPNDAFQHSRLDLSVRGDAQNTPSSLRAFGYFERKVMISERVVHESAAVVDDFDLRFPAQ